MDAKRVRISKKTFAEFVSGLEPMRIRMEVNKAARHEFYMANKLRAMK